MEQLWTNRNSLSDFVQNALIQHQPSVSNIYIAVAFFTDIEAVQNLLLDDCHLRLIVRLGFPTNPMALRKLLSTKNIEIRYYTGSGFHPKLYIFGDKVALLGSANLTKAALLTNQEIVTSIGSDDPRFDELLVLFSEYWN
ncbi:MAG: alcohol dehydrogenase, partial [Gammaproteobacteria bacterium]|nr:alcohol dehydrogenase [Gammaproteobacteria bacterium]